MQRDEAYVVIRAGDVFYQSLYKCAANTVQLEEAFGVYGRRRELYLQDVEAMIYDVDKLPNQLVSYQSFQLIHY